MLDWYEVGITTFIEFVAVVVGVLVAFELDRKHEEHIDRSRQTEFLTFIREEIKANRETVEYLLPELKGSLFLPYFRLRSFAWSALSERMSLIMNDKVRTDIVTAYSKFDMFERTLNRYQDLAYTLLKEFGEISFFTTSREDFFPKLIQPFPEKESERQKLRWKGLFEKAVGARDALITQGEQPKEGIIDFAKMLDSEISEELQKLDR